MIPTETGLAVFRDMMDQRREHLVGLLSRLDDGDLQAFLRGLRAVRAAREAVVAEHAIENASGAAEPEGER